MRYEGPLHLQVLVEACHTFIGSVVVFEDRHIELRKVIACKRLTLFNSFMYSQLELGKLGLAEECPLEGIKPRHKH